MQPTLPYYNMTEKRTVVLFESEANISTFPNCGISPTAGGGGLGRLRSSPPSPSPSPPKSKSTEAIAEVDLDLDEGDLS